MRKKRFFTFHGKSKKKDFWLKNGSLDERNGFLGVISFKMHECVRHYAKRGAGAEKAFFCCLLFVLWAPGSPFIVYK